MNKKGDWDIGIGFIGMLTLIFIVAKIWGKLNWSWWWIISPIWITLGVAVIIIGIVLLVAWIQGK